MEFSHTLDTQIGGQMRPGFAITGFYEDLDEPEALEQLGKYTATYIVTRRGEIVKTRWIPAHLLGLVYIDRVKYRKCSRLSQERQ